MAHAARIGELVESLVTSISGKTTDDTSFKTAHEHAVKGLRDQSHARTNQFAVRDRYAGLVEKFGVLNREDLADALQARLEELPIKSKYLPEVLSLFLELSDRPVEKTKLEDLEAIAAGNAIPAGLTWEDIVGDDPLDEDGIWDDVERGYHSSGDDLTADEDDEPTTSTQATSLGDEDVEVLARAHVVQPDTSVLEDVQKQYEMLKGVSSGNEQNSLSELVLIRETLMMLRGLPTNLYRIETETARITLHSEVAIGTAAKPTLRHALEQCSNIGMHTYWLRRWANRDESTAYLQSMQAATRQLLAGFDRSLAELEQPLVRPNSDAIVSIIDVHAEVEDIARPLVRLCETIQHSRSPSAPFALLDGLYEETCLAHMSGDEAFFAALCDVSLAGSHTYLRSVEQWVKEGTVPKREAEDFFAQEAQSECELGDIWQKRFTLRMLDGVKPSAPSVLQPFVDRIFAMGKARAFIELLEPGEAEEAMTSSDTSGLLTMKGVQRHLDDEPLQPFAQLLESQIESWLSEVGTDCTSKLQVKLLRNHGLLDTVQALQYVYFGKRSDLFGGFAESLFERMRRYPKAWSDRFMLTELAQEHLGNAPRVEADCITVSAAHDIVSQTDDPSVGKLQHLEVQYALQWPVQNVTRSSTLPVHSAAFVLLLQVQYALHVLRKQFFDLRQHSSSSDTLPADLAKALKLRTRLLCFAETLLAHITAAASVSHQVLISQLQAADGVDGMAAVWAEHEKRLQVCLSLAPNLAPIKEAVTGILELAERFAATWSSLEDGDNTAMVKEVSEEAAKLLSFVTAGLRGVSRAGGEAMLETLAERLDWGGG